MMLILAGSERERKNACRHTMTTTESTHTAVPGTAVLAAVTPSQLCRCDAGIYAQSLPSLLLLSHLSTWQGEKMGGSPLGAER